VLLEGHGIDFDAVLAEVGPGPAAASQPVPVGCGSCPDARACQASHAQRAGAGKQLLPEHAQLSLASGGAAPGFDAMTVPRLCSRHSGRHMVGCVAGCRHCTCSMQDAQRAAAAERASRRAQLALRW